MSSKNFHEPRIVSLHSAGYNPLMMSAYTHEKDKGAKYNLQRMKKTRSYGVWEKPNAKDRKRGRE